MTTRKRHTPTEQSGENAAINRRTALIRISTIAAAAGLPQAGAATASSDEAGGDRLQGRVKRVRKIATEEAFMIPEVAAAVRDVVRRGGTNLDLKLPATIYDQPSATPPNGQARPLQAAPPPASNRDALARLLLPKLLDLDQGRLAEMDANGVDVH